MKQTLADKKALWIVLEPSGINRDAGGHTADCTNTWTTQQWAFRKLRGNIKIS